MSHRQKGEHKSRHRTHAIKPASLLQAPLAPFAPLVEDPIPTKAARKSRKLPLADEPSIV